MISLGIAVFLALHGLVHGWYVVLSNGWVEMEDAMGWTGHSWLLSGVLEQGTVLGLASLGYVLVALGFVAAAAGFWLEADWWPTLLLAAATLSTVMIVVLWDGRLDLLVEKGAVGVLINVGLVGWLFLR
ncbi:MAG: hypothetical protein ABEI31_02700 [Halodesulfurarchaeum sp.]